jgi:drug/metabolite transporter, DME family
VSKTSATLSALVAATLWGTTGTTAYLMGGALSPLVIGAATMGFGGLLLFVVGGRTSFGLLSSREHARWVWLGAAGVVVYPLAFYQGMFLAGVAVGNVIALGTGPLIVAVIEWLVERRKPSGGWAVATVLAVMGIVFLTLGDSSKTSAEPGGFIPGILLALVAGFSYALFSYAMGHIMAAGNSPRATVGAVFGGGALPLLIILLALGIPPDVGFGPLGLLGYLILGPMVISYVFFSRALRTLTSSSVLTIALIEPAVATGLALMVVGERFDVVGGVGLALILCAVFFAARGATVR